MSLLTERQMSVHRQQRQDSSSAPTQELCSVAAWAHGSLQGLSSAYSAPSSDTWVCYQWSKQP